MNILVVEDDPFKLDDIRAVLCCQAGVQIRVAASLHSAMIVLESEQFDFVILDMAIPSHTSDAGAIDTYSQPVGGLDVLLFLSSNDRPERVVVLTQYPSVEYDRAHVPLRDLVRVLHEDDVRNVTAAVYFDEDSAWKLALAESLGGDS